MYLHLAQNEGPVVVTYAFYSADLVALSGAVYEVFSGDKNAMLFRVKPAKVPTGVRIPQPDSFTLPLNRPGPSSGARLNHKGLEFVEVAVEKIKRPTGIMPSTASLQVSTKLKEYIYADVVPGDIVLFRDKGYLVRSIIPEDKKTRVAGWVEFAGRPIPEADLIRDKKAYIKPMPKEQKK